MSITMLDMSTLNGENPEKAISLPDRALLLSEELRKALWAVLEACVGGSPRPATLARQLNLGQSLSSRVVRALRSEDPVRLLDDIPAPQGLNMFLDAAEEFGTDRSLIEDGRASVSRFEVLLTEFPTGRAGLNAVLAGFDEEAHIRACNTASQAVYRSMTTMLGFQSDVTSQINFFLPSRENEEFCDQAIIMFKTGVSRLRPSSRITLFGHRLQLIADSQIRVETLDGHDPLEDISRCLLPDLGTCDPTTIEIYRQPELYLFTLPTDQPGFGQSIDICSVMIIRNAFKRYASREKRWAWDTCVPRIPSKVLWIESYVHQSLLRDVPYDEAPALTSSLHGLNHSWERPDHPELDLDQVDLRLSMQRNTDVGTEDSIRLRMRGVTNYVPACQRVLQRLDTPANEYVNFRAQVRYPVPLISHTIWIPLSNRLDQKI